jgi:hypothetical protein
LLGVLSVAFLGVDFPLGVIGNLSIGLEERLTRRWRGFRFEIRDGASRVGLRPIVSKLINIR